MKTPYDNPTSQRARRDELENEGRVHKATFHSHTHDDLGGRFAREFSSSRVGEKPAIEYPRQPPGSPWHDDQPVEPPLGISINEQSPSGEYFEVERSLREAPGGGEQPSSVGERLAKRRR
jgi:hypothetical protein